MRNIGAITMLPESTKDLTICEKIQVQYLKDECYRYIGIAKENISICDEIQDQIGTKEWCYLEVAKAKEDTTPR